MNRAILSGGGISALTVDLFLWIIAQWVNLLLRSNHPFILRQSFLLLFICLPIFLHINWKQFHNSCVDIPSSNLIFTSNWTIVVSTNTPCNQNSAHISKEYLFVVRITCRLSRWKANIYIVLLYLTLAVAQPSWCSASLKPMSIEDLSLVEADSVPRELIAIDHNTCNACDDMSRSLPGIWSDIIGCNAPCNHLICLILDIRLNRGHLQSIWTPKHIRNYHKRMFRAFHPIIVFNHKVWYKLQH